MDLLTIIDAAQLSGKSIQTIRRMIKQRKIKVKRQKTPQGFNYLILKESLMEFTQPDSQADIHEDSEVIDTTREHRQLEESDELDMQDERDEAIQKFREEVGRFNGTIQKLLEQNERDKENFFGLIKTFQDRVFILENQIKLLEAPKPRWWQMWK